MVFQPDRMTRYDEIQSLWRDACAVVVRDIAAEAFDIVPEMILSKQRGKEYVSRARQVAMYLTHVVCSISMTDVGLAFNRERTTVAHACKRVEEMRDDEYIDIQLDLIAEKVQARLEKIKIQDLQAQVLPAAEKKSVVNGQDLEELPLIRTANGRFLEVKMLKM